MKAAALLDLVRAMPHCEQSSHFGTTDFRVRGKIFASHPKPEELVLKLTREQQQMLLETEPKIFRMLDSKWGQLGWTAVRIKEVDRLTAQSALRMAWANVAPKSLQKDL
jgi:hypothetical protein